MKHIKTLGLLAVAAAALMASAGTASATALTSTEGSTPTIKITSSGTSFDGPFVTVFCGHSYAEASITGHGAGVPASGNISKLEFTSCNFPVTVSKAGSLSFTGTSTTGNGTLSWSGATFSIHTSVGTCGYTTNNTHIGTVTGSNNTGGHAVLDLTGKIPRTKGNFLCGSSATWTGSYTFFGPSKLEVH